MAKAEFELGEDGTFVEGQLGAPSLSPSTLHWSGEEGDELLESWPSLEFWLREKSSVRGSCELERAGFASSAASKDAAKISTGNAIQREYPQQR